MKIVEYGAPDNDTIMMLHGGGLSWWNYREEAILLSNTYHVVLPILDGHADSDADFNSIEDNAEKLVEYIHSHLNGKVKALCGLSLGAQIAVEMLSQSSSICDNAIIESVALIPSSPLTNALIAPSFRTCYGLIQKEWFARLQFHSLHIQDKLFSDYYRDSCKISVENLIRFLQASSMYALKPSIGITNAKVLIVAGGKEQTRIRKSAKKLVQQLSNGTITFKKGLFHGEYSLNRPKEYVQDLLRMLEL